MDLQRVLANLIRFSTMFATSDGSVMSDEEIYQLLRSYPSRETSMNSGPLPVSSDTPIPKPDGRNVPKTLGTPHVLETTTGFRKDDNVEEVLPVHDDGLPSPVQHKTIEISSIPQFPDGYLTYSIVHAKHGVSRDDAKKIGWATKHRNQWPSGNELHVTKGCLGIFQCPHAGCMYVQRPLVPRSTSASAPPLRPKKDSCPLHENSLVHIPCNVVITFHESSSVTRVQHDGYHDHLPPWPLRAGPEVEREFRDFVRTHADIGPKALQVGSKSRQSVLAFSSFYAQHSQVTYEWRKALGTHQGPSKDRTPSNDRTPLTMPAVLQPSFGNSHSGSSTFVDIAF
jgi:hypothetical protein